MLRNGNKYLLMLVSIIMLTACISQSRTSGDAANLLI